MREMRRRSGSPQIRGADPEDDCDNIGELSSGGSSYWRKDSGSSTHYPILRTLIAVAHERRFDPEERLFVGAVAGGG